MERHHMEVTAESDRGGQHLIAAMAVHGAEAVIPTAAARLHGHGQEHHRIRDALRAEQVIGFLPHRGVHVAYALTGVGPALLLDVGRAHHLEAFWRYGPYRRLVQRLSRRFTVVRWDRPGYGMSDRRPAVVSARGQAEDTLI